MYSNKSAKTKYVFVTGGVASSLGKGIISSSLARLLLARGYSVAIQKMDPYRSFNRWLESLHNGR